MKLWPGAILPDLQGKTALVTGANSGIGFYTAKALADAGAKVCLACRNPQKGAQAAASIGNQAWLAQLDLADFDSIHQFAALFTAQTNRLDILINNAGVMAPPTRQTTRQGFELQFGVNFLGHFLLTSLLLPNLLNSPGAHVVQVASIAHRQGKMNWDDLQSERHYHGWQAYRQSKLAMLIFAQELARHAARKQWKLFSLAAHPGIAATELVANGPGQNSLIAFLQKIAAPFIQQPGDAGAWPLILAATAPQAKPGDYYGPQGWLECRGVPGLGKIEPKALAPETGGRLWVEALKQTKADFTPAR